MIFALTEDMSNPMVLADRWTLLMACLLVVDLLVAYATRNKKNDDEDDQSEPAPAMA